MSLLYDHKLRAVVDGTQVRAELVGLPRGLASTHVTRRRTEDVVPVQDVAKAQGLVFVHNPAACLGRGCSIHHPSAHHMRAWPMVWRQWGYFERQCSHGVGHPDPDDIAYSRSIRMESGSHGCDGCCLDTYRRPPTSTT